MDAPDFSLHRRVDVSHFEFDVPIPKPFKKLSCARDVRRVD